MSLLQPVDSEQVANDLRQIMVGIQGTLESVLVNIEGTVERYYDEKLKMDRERHNKKMNILEAQLRKEEGR